MTRYIQILLFVFVVVAPVFAEADPLLTQAAVEKLLATYQVV
jgi:hypothetical protein